VVLPGKTGLARADVLAMTGRDLHRLIGLIKV